MESAKQELVDARNRATYFPLKRLFDITLSFLGLMICSPVMLLIAAAIKATSRGPAFYRGRRAGVCGKPFHMWKFRTMVLHADSLGGSATPDDDPRITRFGYYLRKYKLDEIPQLWNVLKGEMSFVGPRPEIPEYIRSDDEREKVILGLRPGITDWASIWDCNEGSMLLGRASPEHFYLESIRPVKVHLEYCYALRCSFWLDMKIIMYTLYRLLNRAWAPREMAELLQGGAIPGSAHRRSKVDPL